MCFSWQTSDFLRRIWTCYDIFLWSDDSTCFWPVIIWLLLGKLWTDFFAQFQKWRSLRTENVLTDFWLQNLDFMWTPLTTFNVGWRFVWSPWAQCLLYSTTRMTRYFGCMRLDDENMQIRDVDWTGCIQSDRRRDSCKLAATTQKHRICSSQIQCIYYHSLDSTTTDSDILHSSLRQSCSVSYTSVTGALEVSSNDMPICAI